MYVWDEGGGGAVGGTWSCLCMHGVYMPFGVVLAQNDLSIQKIFHVVG